MHVDLGLVGQVVIHDVRDVAHVEAARGDVGGDEDRDALTAERDHHGVAGALAHVTVQRADLVAAALEIVGELLRADLGAREDDRGRRLHLVDEALQQLELVAALGVRDALRDRIDRDLLGGDLDVLGAMQLLLRQLLDRIGHRGAEQRGLLAPRRALHDVADVVDEAHREHLIGLVENDHATVGEDHLAAAQEVEHATGGADDDLAAAVERGDLLDDRRTAVDGHDADTLEVLGEGTRGLGDLQRELARRAQHEGLEVLRFGVDPVEDRQHERRRLAGSGLGLADHVLIAQQRVHGPLLNRRGLLVTEVVQRAQDLRLEIEVFKTQDVSFSSVTRGTRQHVPQWALDGLLM